MVEGFLIIPDDGCGVEIPAAIAFGGVSNLTSVGVEAHRTFLLGGVGDALGDLEINGGDEDLATRDKGDFLAVR